MKSLFRYLLIGFGCSALLLTSPVLSSGSPDHEYARTEHAAPVVKILTQTTAPDQVPADTDQTPAPTASVVSPAGQSLITLTQLQQIVHYQKMRGAYLSLTPGTSVWDLSRGKRKKHRYRYGFGTSRPFTLTQPPRID
jgi:hypothetical protein